mgnify:CR=1 FL=1
MDFCDTLLQLVRHPCMVMFYLKNNNYWLPKKNHGPYLFPPKDTVVWIRTSCDKIQVEFLCLGSKTPKVGRKSGRYLSFSRDPSEVPP